MIIRIKGKCKCDYLHIEKLYFGQIIISMKEKNMERHGDEFCCCYSDFIISENVTETQISQLQGKDMTAIKTRCEKSEHNNCNEKRDMGYCGYLELELDEIVFLEGNVIIKQILPPWKGKSEIALLEAIDEGLSNRYKVLDGDYDMLYVMDRKTGQKYEIKVKELHDD